MSNIISKDRTIIPACDFDSLDRLMQLVIQTNDNPLIGAYKVGFELALSHGLPKVVDAARTFTGAPIIYDHQKAGTDIPDTGNSFARVCKKAGVDAVILFPQAGPETEKAWISSAFDNGLKVIVGGRMTHKAYVVSEGGFITDEGSMEIYRTAARMGVNNFVVPGNKVDVIRRVRKIVNEEGVYDAVFYAPGFVAQGGEISDGAKAAGDKFHAIVGRGIYDAPDMRVAALELTSKL